MRRRGDSGSAGGPAILRERLPDLKLRFVNVVDLFRMQPASEHPHGSTDREFDSLFTVDKPIIFNFHGYPWLIHKLAYRFRNHENLHVRGYKEKGNINTPLELAILNQVDRFNLVIDVLDRVPRLQDERRISGKNEERHHRQPELCAYARHRPHRNHRLGVARVSVTAQCFSYCLCLDRRSEQAEPTSLSGPAWRDGVESKRAAHRNHRHSAHGEWPEGGEIV